jgi:hypothetical protein
MQRHGQMFFLEIFYVFIFFLCCHQGGLRLCEKEFNDFSILAAESTDLTFQNCSFLSCSANASCARSEFVSSKYFPRADSRLLCVALADERSSASILSAQIDALKHQCAVWALLAPRSVSFVLATTVASVNATVVVADDFKTLLSQIPAAVAAFHRVFLFRVRKDVTFPSPFGVQDFADRVECGGFDNAPPVGFASLSTKSSAAFFARSEFLYQLFGPLLSPTREFPPASVICKMAHAIYSFFDPDTVGCVRDRNDALFVPLDSEESEMEYRKYYPNLPNFEPKRPKCL